MDFVDTGTAGLGRQRISDAGRKDLDLFSQLKHMQPIPRSGGHRSVPSTASESEIAGVRRSLATVLQLLLPYGRLQHRPHLSADDAIGSYEEEALFGEPLVPDGPDTANYMLHGKLVEIGPRQRTAFGSSTDGENRNAGTVDESFGTVGQKRAAALRSTMARRSHIMPTGTQGGGGGTAAEEGSFMPSISVGALTNLGDFFQNLKHNLESLESKNLNNDQVKLLEGQNMISNLRKGTTTRPWVLQAPMTPSFLKGSSIPEFVEDYPKPAGSAAFLHAIRNYRPSHRIRALVSTVPELYRGTNFHDPVYMLAGLGK
uniref:Uncharacterized protein n=1 Tax=Anopheles melas TaxID=34690 RepID=A0A182TGE7_9DIPT